MKSLSLFSAIFFLFSIAAYAGAWTQKKGATQLITTARIYKTNHFFDRRGNRISQNNYYKQELSQYGEYGWRENITIGGSVTLARAFQDNGFDISSNWGFDNTNIFIRRKIWENEKITLSLQPFFIFPSFYNATNVPKIGSDKAGFGLAFNNGYSFKLWGRSHYIDKSIDYTHRLGNARDQIHGSATLGLSVSNRWTLMPQIFTTRAVNNQHMQSFTQSTNDDYNQTTIQLSALYHISPKYSAQLGVYKEVMGRNAGAGSGVQLSLWTNF